MAIASENLSIQKTLQLWTKERSNAEVEYHQTNAMLLECRNKLELGRDLLKATDLAFKVWGGLGILKSLSNFSNKMLKERTVQKMLAIPRAAYKGFVVNSLKSELKSGPTGRKLQEKLIKKGTGAWLKVFDIAVENYWHSPSRIYSRATIGFLSSSVISPEPSRAVESLMKPILRDEGFSIEKAIAEVNDQLVALENSWNESIRFYQEKMDIARRGSKAESQIHIVCSGDTLWRISEKYTGEGRHWARIWDLNVGTIGSNPDLIFPGQRLIIVPK